MTGSWKGKVNQYIQLVKVLCCTDQQQANTSFPTGQAEIRNCISEVGGECLTTVPPWPQVQQWKKVHNLEIATGQVDHALIHFTKKWTGIVYGTVILLE